MIIRERLLDLLEENGLFPYHAKDVLMHFAQSAPGASIGTQLDEPLESYSPQVLAETCLSVRRSAVDWIDANPTLCWARPMFAD